LICIRVWCLQLTQAASKADLGALGERLERFVREQIAVLRAEMRMEMQQQKVEILKWVFAAAIGQTSLIIAAIRYMPH
jgi:hypothetical protein